VRSVDEIRSDYRAAHKTYQGFWRAEVAVLERWSKAQAALSANPLCPDAQQAMIEANAARVEASEATTSALRVRDTIFSELMTAERAALRS
jgi:hypothetical protein